MFCHKVSGNTYWEINTICGVILPALNDGDFRSTVWSNTDCPKCKESVAYKTWSKKQERKGK